MEVREISQDEKELWNNFVKDKGTLLQSWEWGEFKSKSSWKAFRLALVEKDEWLLAAQVLSKKLPFSKSFLYVPEGPVAPAGAAISNQQSALSMLLKKIKGIAQKENSIFLRIEPLIESSKIQDDLQKLNFKKSFEDIQPTHRLWIDLRKSEEEILAQMKHKGRYNIKLAQRKGVTIKETVDPKMLDVFYSLYLETARRDRFAVRPKKYFKELLDTFSETGYGKMFVAFFKKQPLSATLVTFFGKYVTYLYGGTKTIHRELMASYLVQWEAIRKAKEGGFQIYDFGAIAPSETPNHPWAGLRQFKMKFGGREIDFPGCYDLVYKPLWYDIFKVVEKIRRKKL